MKGGCEHHIKGFWVSVEANLHHLLVPKMPASLDTLYPTLGLLLTLLSRPLLETFPPGIAIYLLFRWVFCSSFLPGGQGHKSRPISGPLDPLKVVYRVTLKHMV